MVRVDWGKRRRDERGRKEGGKIKGRIVAAGQEKNVSQWQQQGLALFHTWKKEGPPFLLLSSSSFNSKYLKAEGTPGQFFVSFILEATQTCGVQIKASLASLLDSCCIVHLSVHKSIFILLVSWSKLTFLFVCFDFYFYFTLLVVGLKPFSVFSNSGEFFMSCPRGSTPGSGTRKSKHQRKKCITTNRNHWKTWCTSHVAYSSCSLRRFLKRQQICTLCTKPKLY